MTTKLNPCNGFLQAGRTNGALPQYRLQKLDGDNWVTVQETTGNSGLSFSSLSKGEYRVACRLPSAVTSPSSACTNPNPGNFIHVNNFGGQFIGFRGVFDVDNELFSNVVAVGPTNQQDIVMDFIDPTDGNSFAYDSDEDVLLDLTESKNYDETHIGIFESGPLLNRSRGTGVQQTKWGVFDLKNFWNYGFNTPNGSPWNLLENHSYNVQVMMENSRCRNSSWNQKFQNFFVCTAGSGCRLDFSQKEVKVGPNPTTGVTKLHNFDYATLEKYTLHVIDVNGKILRNHKMSSTVIDLDGFPSGTYFVNIIYGSQKVFSTKLAVI